MVDVIISQETFSYMLYGLMGLFFPALFGLYKLWPAIKQRLALREGKILARFITPNLREKEEWVLPKNRNISRGNKDNYDFNDEPGMIVFKGNIPIASYNQKTRQQINMSHHKVKQEIDPEHYNHLLVRMYNLGKMAGKQEGNIIIILLAVVLLLSAANLYFGFNAGTAAENISRALESLGTQFNTLSTQIEALKAAAGSTTAPQGIR